jgi:hypothetical protein
MSLLAVLAHGKYTQKKKLKSEVIVGATCLHFLWSVDLSRVVVALRKWE